MNRHERSEAYERINLRGFPGNAAVGRARALGGGDFELKITNSSSSLLVYLGVTRSGGAKTFTLPRYAAVNLPPDDMPPAAPRGLGFRR